MRTTWLSGYYDEAKQGVTEVYYRQYAQDLRRFVSFLRSKAGDVKGQRVAILARNSYHYIICMYGTVLAGGVAVPLNMGKNWDEIQYELDLVEPVCVLQDGEYLQWGACPGGRLQCKAGADGCLYRLCPRTRCKGSGRSCRDGLYHVLPPAPPAAARALC